MNSGLDRKPHRDPPPMTGKQHDVVVGRALDGCLVLALLTWYGGRSESHSVMSNSLRAHGLHSPWNSPGQNTGVGSLSLLQGIFPTQESNPGLLHYGWILYKLSHKGSPRILEWVAYPFVSRFSQIRNRTGVSCFAGGFCTSWAIRDSYLYLELYLELSLKWAYDTVQTGVAVAAEIVPFIKYLLRSR